MEEKNLPEGFCKTLVQRNLGRGVPLNVSGSNWAAYQSDRPTEICHEIE